MAERLYNTAKCIHNISVNFLSLKENVMQTQFNFFMPAEILSGKDIVKNSENVFSSLGKKCLIVTGKSSAEKCGALADVTSALRKAEIKYSVFNKITENPLTVTCFEGGKAARDFNADFVIGIGGGSPLDAAKAICVYASNSHIVNDGIYTEEVKNPPLPLVLIGTTAGTGSEVSSVSVLTRENGRKQSVSGKNYYAKYVLADPKYTYSLPASSTVSTALDAFAHAVESYFSKKHDFLSRKFSCLAVGETVPFLSKFTNPDFTLTENERDSLYYASLYAGFALNKGETCFPHGMGYALTEDYGVPHGMACAVFIPAFLKEAKKGDAEGFAEIIKACGISENELWRLLNTLCKADITIPIEKIEEYRVRWATLKNFKNSPTDFNADDGASLVYNLFGE